MTYSRENILDRQKKILSYITVTYAELYIKEMNSDE